MGVTDVANSREFLQRDALAEPETLGPCARILEESAKCSHSTGARNSPF
jgi:hypothetical protein